MLHFHFDQNLHEVPEDRENMRTATEYYAAKCIDEENHITAGLIASYYRILHEYDKAQYWVNIAIELAQKNRSRKSIYINKLRLSHIHCWMKDFKSAKTLLDEVGMEIQDNHSYQDLRGTYHQHLGKWFFDQGMLAEALENFKLTLQIRQLQGSKDLIESSTYAVYITEQRILSLN